MTTPVQIRAHDAILQCPAHGDPKEGRHHGLISLLLPLVTECTTRTLSLAEGCEGLPLHAHQMRSSDYAQEHDDTSL